jgi:hypothetical protein
MIQRDAFRKLCQEAEQLELQGKLTREAFQDYLRQALELVGDDREVLHGLLSIAPKSWREGILEPVEI